MVKKVKPRLPLPLGEGWEAVQDFTFFTHSTLKALMKSTQWEKRPAQRIDPQAITQPSPSGRGLVRASEEAAPGWRADLRVAV